MRARPRNAAAGARAAPELRRLRADPPRRDQAGRGLRDAGRVRSSRSPVPPVLVQGVIIMFCAALAVIAGSVATGRLGQLGPHTSDPGAALAHPVAGRRARPRPAATAHDPLRARVVHVVDGDTIDARLDDGSIQRVRLIGIDTPEKYTTRTGHTECGGEDASRETRTIAARWLDVTLRPDRTQDAYDTYGRLLAYVVPASATGTTYQEAILRAGWAKVYVYDHHPFSEVAAFRAAAAQARRAEDGVWRACGGEFRRPEGD